MQKISSKTNQKFRIGEIVSARDRLWRIDQIHHNTEKNYNYYSVSNITGIPSSQILIPNIEPIKKSTIPKPSEDVIGSPRYQKLLLDAIRLDLIYSTSSFISLQNSKVIPISYQMVPVLMALNLSKVRLLLADDVGLGKTIETGLILQELLGRKKINRVLFITPANLREQWQTIMRNFFDINAVIMSRKNRRHLESELLVGGNPWGYYNFIITSVDYAKRSGIREEIWQFDWDMVVIDEAHNVMLPHLGVDDENSKNMKQSYFFAKKITEKYKNILLLTATPHNGYKDSFASLLRFISEDMVSGKGADIEINRDIALNHVCQRRREDVVKWIKESYSGNPFPERDADEIFITPSQQFGKTMELLDKFAEQVLEDLEIQKKLMKSYGEKNLEDLSKMNFWTILHFHKRAISSPQALICSIDNRLEEIDKKINKKYLAVEDFASFLSKEEAGQSVLDGVETDRLSEEERDLRNDKIVLTKSMESLKTEKKLLLEVKKSAIELKKHDSKMTRLLEEIITNRLKVSNKIIIFTRYIDTLNYIEKNIQKTIDSGSLKYRGMELYAVHGQLPSQKRVEIYNNFLKAEKGIMISTDCMAEGIDLQFSANQIINYELTWNPNRLEQRNGRVDRFGQPKKKVYIRTIILKDTLEMDILELLVKKATDIKEEYGFVPGFFGDPADIIDRLIEKRRKEKKKRGTLERWVKFSEKIRDKMIDVFFSKENIEEMIKDSFYGHNNINLEDVEERMRITEQNIGDSNTLLNFTKSAIELYQGNLIQTKDNPDIYQVDLPKEIQKEIRFEFGENYLITPKMEISSARFDVDGISLKNQLVSGLIEKIRNEAFEEDNIFYGRTAAYASRVVSKVTALYDCKLRYVVNTEPKTIIEEISTLGLDLFNSERIVSDDIETLRSSKMENHGKPEIFLKKHLKAALELSDLQNFLKDLGKERLGKIIQERKEIIKKLSQQGFASDLKGIDNVDIVGIDLLTITLVYPYNE